MEHAQLTVDSIKEIMKDTITSLETRVKGLEKMYGGLEERLESIDQLQAVLITMYAEMFAGIEALAAVVAGSDEETRKQLTDKRDEAVKALWGLLGQQATTTLEDMDDETRAAMEHFVRGTQPSTN